MQQQEFPPTAFTVTPFGDDDAGEPYKLVVAVVAPSPSIEGYTRPSMRYVAGVQTLHNSVVLQSSSTSGLEFAVTAGTLPSGLELDAATGTLRGIPNEPSPKRTVTITAKRQQAVVVGR